MCRLVKPLVKINQSIFISAPKTFQTITKRMQLLRRASRSALISTHQWFGGRLPAECFMQDAGIKSSEEKSFFIFLYTFATIMKLISFILAFYVLLCAAIPCCADDDCAGTVKTEKKGGDCKGDCSPFFACGNCCGFSINVQQIAVTPITVFKKTSYSEFYISAHSDYYHSFWQPPRLG